MRKKVKSRPRISVFRSNKHIYAQIIDDDRGVTLFTMNDKNLVKGKDKKKRELTKKEEAFLVGENLAKEALKKNVRKVIFDRGHYRYHGRVKALADGARKGGLDF